MAVTAHMYGNALLKALSKDVDWLNDTVKVMLCTSGYSPNQDTHIYKSDVTNEVTSDGYTAGGMDLTNKTMTYDAASNTIKLDADDTAWSNASITARYAVIYDDAGATDGAKVLLGYVDFGEDKMSSSGDFMIQWSDSGIFNITAS